MNRKRWQSVANNATRLSFRLEGRVNAGRASDNALMWVGKYLSNIPTTEESITAYRFTEADRHFVNPPKYPPPRLNYTNKPNRSREQNDAAESTSNPCMCRKGYSTLTRRRAGHHQSMLAYVPANWTVNGRFDYQHGAAAPIAQIAGISDADSHDADGRVFSRYLGWCDLAW